MLSPRIAAKPTVVELECCFAREAARSRRDLATIRVARMMSPLAAASVWLRRKRLRLTAKGFSIAHGYAKL